MVNGARVLVLSLNYAVRGIDVNIPAPAYDDLASLLASYGDAFTASECHGLLCAMASCMPGLDGETWARRMLGGEIEAILEGTEAPTGIGVDAGDRQALEALYNDTVKQLADPDLGFQLLLPDDETPLTERTRALASWCEGYLYGLGVAGIKEFGGFSEPVQEFAKDLSEIARLGHEAEDDGEEGETAFFDISEYVRMGAMMLCDELRHLASNDEKPKDEGDDRVLH